MYTVSMNDMVSTEYTAGEGFNFVPFSQFSGSTETWQVFADRIVLRHHCEGYAVGIVDVTVHHNVKFFGIEDEENMAEFHDRGNALMFVAEQLETLLEMSTEEE